MSPSKSPAFFNCFWLQKTVYFIAGSLDGSPLGGAFEPPVSKSKAKIVSIFFNCVQGLPVNVILCGNGIFLSNSIGGVFLSYRNNSRG